MINALSNSWLATSLLDVILPQEPWKHWQLPVQASTFAAGHDALYVFVEWTCYFFFFGIMGVLLYSVIKYRRKTEDQPPASFVTHHTAIEVTWTVGPLIICMIIFAWGWKDMSDMLLAPADSLQYEVRAKRWSWGIKHPKSSEWTDNEIWVPINEPCQLTMSSADVLHSFFVPAFRVKRDVLPGRYQTVWFEATVLGDYRLFCTEYCGKSHSAMVGIVHVVTREEFDKKPWDIWTGNPLTDGEKLYRNKCKQCHNNDDTQLVGPGFKGLFDRTRKRLPGKDPEETEQNVLAYIRQSIREPSAYIVPGITPGMSPFPEDQLSEERLGWIITYLKTLK
jgi:cytochrome c oxidase subunit 2